MLHDKEKQVMEDFFESAPLAEARDYERRMEQYVDQGSRPCFHLTPRAGWMNDPNGFSYYQGAYHLFYQYNPYATSWAAMHWGHAVSKDFLHWDYLPVALAPDEPYDDKEGCFSGSAIELPDGRHLLLYTGVGAGRRKKDGRMGMRQVQCVAIGDGVDYVKSDYNPVIGSENLTRGASIEHFRDPKIWQCEDGTYRCVVGATDAEGSGEILLFESDDAILWRKLGVLAANHDRYGTMWECPDFFELDGKSVLLVSPQFMLPEGHEFYSGNGTLCTIGHIDEQTGRLVEESLHTIDHGIDFYATQTMQTPDGRRVMIAWMQNWDTITESPDAKGYKGWYGQMTLPRELSVRDGRLCQWPVREIESLRHDRVCYENVPLEGKLRLEGVSGRVVDLRVKVRAQDEANPYQEFTIWFAQDERFHCSLRYRPKTGTLKINRIHAGSRRAYVHHRKCDISGAPCTLDLRLVMDKHSIEVFINGGVQTMTMTIPTDLSADDITFFAEGKVVMDVEKFDLA